MNITPTHRSPPLPCPDLARSRGQWAVQVLVGKGTSLDQELIV